MIELIAEHSNDTVIMRGTVNNNLIVTSHNPSAVKALIEFAKVLKDTENTDLWTESFKVTHEFPYENIG